MARLFHGTRGISDQIYRKLGFTQHSNQHIQRHVEGNRGAKEFADKRMPSKFSKGEELDGGIQFLSPLRQQIPTVNYPIEDFFEDRRQLMTAKRSCCEGIFDGKSSGLSFHWHAAYQNIRANKM